MALGLGTAGATVGPVRGQTPPTLVRHPPPEAVPDQRNDYPIRVLQLALARSGGNYLAAPSATPMAKGRAVLELAREGSGLDVLWAMTNPERERLLLPVRFPIDRGLLGWRVPLVRRPDADLLREVRELRHLQRFVAGQGHDWPDLKILQANGLRVEGVNSYPALFSMLGRGRFDYLPRSVIEVMGEQAWMQQEGLVLDSHLALHYPAALYFFVRRDRQDLADALQRGLELAQQDGSFEALFHATHEPYLRHAQLQRRTVLELVNPLLTKSLPLHRRDWWWQLPSAEPGSPRSRPA